MLGTRRVKTPSRREGTQSSNHFTLSMPTSEYLLPNGRRVSECHLSPYISRTSPAGQHLDGTARHNDRLWNTSLSPCFIFSLKSTWISCAWGFRLKPDCHCTSKTIRSSRKKTIANAWEHQSDRSRGQVANPSSAFRKGSLPEPIFSATAYSRPQTSAHALATLVCTSQLPERCATDPKKTWSSLVCRIRLSKCGSGQQRFLRARGAYDLGPFQIRPGSKKYTSKLQPPSHPRSPLLAF